MARQQPERTRKGEPFSVRFTMSTDRTIQEEARRTRRSKSAVVEALTEEAVRTRRFPGIAFRGDDSRRRAWVIGSGLDVWEIIHMLEDFGSIQRLVKETQLNERQVRLAVAYRDADPEEISDAIAENRRPVDDWLELYPFVHRTANS
jgi:signal recognition particle GTPase